MDQAQAAPDRCADVKLTKARRAPDLNDEARERIMHAESLIKLFATDPAEALKQTMLFGHSVPLQADSTMSAPRSCRSSSAGRGETAQAIARAYIEDGNDAAYMRDIGYDPAIRWRFRSRSAPAGWSSRASTRASG